MVRHGVKLAAQHLSESRRILLAAFGVAGPVALPLPCAVFASELWSAGNTASVPWMSPVCVEHASDRNELDLESALLLWVATFPLC